MCCFFCARAAVDPSFTSYGIVSAQTWRYIRGQGDDLGLAEKHPN
jgi:hypothetical protein